MTVPHLPAAARAAPGPTLAVEVALRELDLDAADRDAELLEPGELERAGRFRDGEDRRRYLAARAWLRRRLARRTRSDPRLLRFGETGRGKPVLLDAGGRPGHVHFSLAHSGRIAAVAIAPAPVGVDVEVERAEAWNEAMAALVLSPEELAFVAGSASKSRDFFRCWTRKEAYSKVDGGGLVDELARLTLTPRLPMDLGTQLVDTSPSPGVRVAVAVRTELPVELTGVTWDDLITERPATGGR